MAFWRSLSPNGRGAIFLLASSFLFALQAVAIKSLAPRLDIWQIVFIRSAFLALMILPVAWHKRVLHTPRLSAHFLRAVLGLAGFLTYVYAISHAPLAEVTAISFTKVLFVVLFAIFLFGERVGWHRWLAVFVGFAGVLIMVRPGAAPLDPALLAALAHALFAAGIVMTVKQLSRTEAPETIVFFFGTFAALMMLVPALLTWAAPTAEEWLFLIGLSLVGTLGQSLGVRGWAEGEASAMAPLAYVHLIYAGLLGYFIFAEVPDLLTIAGSCVIIASTLYITLREARKKAAAPAAAIAVPAE
jgi:drug/metabolite transporter (DMT)-like permease